MAFNFRKNMGKFENGLMRRDEARVRDGCFGWSVREVTMQEMIVVGCGVSVTRENLGPAEFSSRSCSAKSVLLTIPRSQITYVEGRKCSGVI